MKVRVLSDLHLEFGDFDPGEGDVLVLAGDICTASSFLWRGEELIAERYSEFFNKCVSNYNKVFYVLGNHEHYNGYLDCSAQTLREYLPDDITILDDQSEYYEGWHFVGSTLWTNFSNESHASIESCSELCNEYNYIWKTGGKSNITTSDILTEHKESVTWLNQCLPTLRGNVMVITHHAPSFESIEPDYVGSETVGAYASNLEGLIAKNNIDIWIHGHIHATQSYRLHGTHVISNPRGYHPHGINPKFNSVSEIDLKDYEKNLL